MNLKKLCWLYMVLFLVTEVAYSQPMQPTRIHPDQQFSWGIASYAFRESPLEEVLTVAQKLQVRQLAIKSLHLPLEASTVEINQIRQAVQDAGAEIYAGAVIYMKTAEEVNAAYAYAEKAGMEVIVGVPNPELIPLCEKLSIKYDIRLAIHNHGSYKILYPDAGSAYELIKDRDQRLGLCIDIGHTARLNLDPADEIRKYADRVYDIQIWDSSSASAEGQSILPGFGVIDMASVMQALLDIGYSGVVSVEFWTDPERPELGTAYTLGYLNAILHTLPHAHNTRHNQLTEKEKAEGWQLLFDGNTTRGWRGINQESFPENGWHVRNGELWAEAAGGAESSNGGDIVTTGQFDDFELKWEWKMIDRGGNSGLKYFVQDGMSSKSLHENDKYGFGLEYQLLDDANHPWMLEGKMKAGDYRTVGSLYEIYAPENKKLMPLGQYNKSRILVKGKHVEHWLNGIRVLTYERGSEDFRKRVLASKFKDVPNFGELNKGHILLQDHGSRVAYRNIKIREL